MTGKITTSHNTTTYIAGNQGNALINSSTTAGAYVMLYRYPSTKGYFTMGGYQDRYLLQYTNKSTVDAGTNTVNKSVTLLDESGNTRFAGTVSAPTFTGALSGNASTATTLQTARTINGTPFNGSGNITTANWGTARTITIGNTSKSVNGAGNVSWSLTEIGASTGAVVNTVAQRDHNSDLSVRLVRATYSDQTSISGALAFRVNNNSDNYVRFCSNTTAIKNWLGLGSIPTHAPLITNLNSQLQSGWYSLNPSTSGRPSGVDYGVVLQMKWYNGADFYQICITSDNARMYTRGYINGGYTSWNEK